MAEQKVCAMKELLRTRARPTAVAVCLGDSSGGCRQSGDVHLRKSVYKFAFASKHYFPVTYPIVFTRNCRFRSCVTFTRDLRSTRNLRSNPLPRYHRAMSVPVITVEQMRQWEDASWDAGRAEADVIENVGRAVANVALRMTREDDRILILAGKGHNGEDARHAQPHLMDRK